MINSRRSWIIEQLGGLIRSGSIPKNDDWVQSILDFLIVHGLFTVKKKDEKSRFLAVRSSCQLVVLMIWTNIHCSCIPYPIPSSPMSSVNHVAPDFFLVSVISIRRPLL